MINVSPVFPACPNAITHGIYISIPKMIHRPEYYNVFKDGPAVIVVHRRGRRFRLAADAKINTFTLEDGTKVNFIDFTVCKVYIAHEAKTCTFNSLSEGLFEIEKRCKEI